MGCTATLWSVSDRTPRATRIATVSGGSAVFSPDGRAVATRAVNDTVILWSLADPRRPRRPTRTGVLRRETQGAGIVAFAPDLASVGGAAVDGENAVSLWPIA